MPTSLTKSQPDRRTCRRLVLLALALLLSACGGGDTPSPTSTVPSAPEAAAPPAVSAAELLTLAYGERAIGNDEAAANTLQTLLASYPDAPEARAAQYYLAESFARRNRWTSALAAFRMVLAAPDADSFQERALFWLARCYEEAGDWQSAIDTYAQYRALNTPLAPYAAVRQAALYQAQGAQAEAARLYTDVAAQPISPAERAGSYERAIALSRELGQDTQALDLYRGLIDLAQMPAYRARILSEAATLADALGEPDTARAWQRAIIDAAPTSPQAVAAVSTLRTAGALDAATAGRTLFAAQDYAAALPVLTEASAQAPGGSPEALELERLRGLAQRALGDFSTALETLAAVAQGDTTQDVVRQARLDWIQTRGQQGDTTEAATAYEDYARQFAEDARSPEALARAATLRERLGDSAGAMQVRLALGERWPQSEQASNALRTAGWHFANSGQADRARRAWEQLAQHPDRFAAAQGAFWAARLARQQGDSAQANQLFAQARAAAPDSYYGKRAADELGLALAGTVPPGASIAPETWQAAADWIATWQAAPPDPPDWPALYDRIASEPQIRRAIGLHAVGLPTEAVNEWNAALDRWQAEPLRLLAVGRLAHEQAMPYIEIVAARRIVALLPADAPPERPLALDRLLFPTPYAPLVLAESRAQDIDPLLFYALMRQESLFRPAATSWVGARGLAQIMPETGTGIAQNLGVSDFQLDDLYHPAVSVRFGTFYLGQRLADMQGSPHGALAAYNGGLGNAYRWADGASVADPDMFTATIDFAETRTYVQLVYGYYGAYQRIYTHP